MKNNNNGRSKKSLSGINEFIDKTDIRLLVFVPPVVGFAALLAIMLILNKITNSSLMQPIKNIVLGILILCLSFSGYAEIYKREMPGALGGIYKGNWAVVSGFFIVVMSLFFGITIILLGLSTLLNSTTG